MGNYGTIITIRQNSIAHSGQQSTAEQFITCHLVSSRDDPPCHKAEDTGDGPLVSARYGWQPGSILPPMGPDLATAEDIFLWNTSGEVGRMLQASMSKGQGCCSTSYSAQDCLPHHNELISPKCP